MIQLPPKAMVFHEVSRQLSRLKDWKAERRDSLKKDVAEFLLEESDVLPYKQALTQLREENARLKQELESLKAQLAARDSHAD
jgi:ubiquinone biosynthesis protein UbiJ